MCDFEKNIYLQYVLFHMFSFQAFLWPVFSNCHTNFSYYLRVYSGVLRKS